MESNLRPGLPRARGPAPTVICYLCGRQFGSKSIDIHTPQCEKKFQAAQAKLPKSQRRKLPPKPEKILVAGTSQIDTEATNEAAWEASKAAMLECEHCGRRFNPDRLAVHQRSCTADNPAKAVGKKK